MRVGRGLLEQQHAYLLPIGNQNDILI